MRIGVLFRWIAATGILVGCLSPTLPIPPPDSPLVSAPDTSGTVTVKGNAGSAKPSAIVSVWNASYVSPTNGTSGTGVDVPAADDGSWAATISGKSGDLLYISQTYNSERSAELYVYVPTP